MSGKYAVFLDPHKIYLPDEQAGCRYDMTDSSADLPDSTWANSYPDQFAPFVGIPAAAVPNPPDGEQAFAADGTTAHEEYDGHSFFNGTLFRFPLRSVAAAKRSLITDPPCCEDGAMTPEKVLELFDSFIVGAKERLLFLKNIDSIAFYTLTDPGEEAPRSVAESAATSAPEAQARQTSAKRGLFSRLFEKKKPSFDDDALLMPPLPAGWSAHPDPQGREYYWNSVTNVTQWERPGAAPTAVVRSASTTEVAPGLHLVFAASLADISDGVRAARRGWAAQLKAELKSRAKAMTPAQIAAAERDGLPPMGAAFFDLMAATAGSDRPKKWRNWWKASSFELRIVVRQPGAADVIDRWMVSQSVGEGGVAQYAAESGRQHRLCLLPYVAVAARLGRAGVASTFSRNRLVGKCFCMLPISDQGPNMLPVHVDARWELDSSRAHILTSTDSHGIGAIRTKWNELLAQRVLPRAYARLVGEICAANPGLSPQQYYSHFPTKVPEQAWFARCVKPFYELLKASDAHVMAPATSGAPWISIDRAVFRDSTLLRHDSAARRQEARAHDGIVVHVDGDGELPASDDEDADHPIEEMRRMMQDLREGGQPLDDAARHAWSEFIRGLPQVPESSDAARRLRTLRLAASVTMKKWGDEKHGHATPRASVVQRRARERWGRLRMWLASQADTAAAVELLLGDLGFPLTRAPRRIFKELHAAGLEPRSLAPAMVRDYFRVPVQPGASHSALAWDGAAAHVPFERITAQWPAIRGPHAMLPLLAYCISDAAALKLQGKHAKAFERLPLLPLGDGSRVAIVGAEGQDYQHFVAKPDALALLTPTSDIRSRCVMSGALLRAPHFEAAVKLQWCMRLRALSGLLVADVCSEMNAHARGPPIAWLQQLWRFIERQEQRPTHDPQPWMRLCYANKHLSNSSALAGDDLNPAACEQTWRCSVNETRAANVIGAASAQRGLLLRAKGALSLPELPANSGCIQVSVNMRDATMPDPTITCGRMKGKATFSPLDGNGNRSAFMSFKKGDPAAGWTMTPNSGHSVGVTELIVFEGIGSVPDPYLKAVIASAPMASLADYHLLPLRDGRVAKVGDARGVLDAGGNDGTSRAGDQGALDALITLGCPVLHSSVRSCVAHRIALARVNAAGIIAALTMVHRREGDAVFAAQVGTIPTPSFAALLNRIADDVASLSEASCTDLRKLPVFRLAGGALTSVERPPDGLSAWFVEPAGSDEATASRASLSSDGALGARQCLRQEPRLRDLYAKLGLRELSRAVYYVEVVFPELMAMEPAARLNHLGAVRRSFAEVVDEAAPTDRKRFVATLKELAFVPLPSADGGGGKQFVRACDVFDPRSAAMASFFASRTPRALKGSPFGTLEWLQFLEQLGMKRVLSADLILSVAREIDKAARAYATPGAGEAYVGPLTRVTASTAVAMARQLLLHLSSAGTDALPAAGDALWDELSSLSLVRLAEPHDGGAGYAEWRRGRRLAPACEVAPYLDRSLCWSQLPVMSLLVSGLLPTSGSLSVKLKMRRRVAIDVALAHLLFLTENFNAQCEVWRLRGRLPYTVSRLRSEISCVFSAISPAVFESPDTAEIVRQTLNGRKFVPVSAAGKGGATKAPLVFVGGASLFREIFAQVRLVALRLHGRMCTILPASYARQCGAHAFRRHLLRLPHSTHLRTTTRTDRGAKSTSRHMPTDSLSRSSSSSRPHLGTNS